LKSCSLRTQVLYKTFKGDEFKKNSWKFLTKTIKFKFFQSYMTTYKDHNYSKKASGIGAEISKTFNSLLFKLWKHPHESKKPTFWTINFQPILSFFRGFFSREGFNKTRLYYIWKPLNASNSKLEVRVRKLKRFQPEIQILVSSGIKEATWLIFGFRRPDWLGQKFLRRSVWVPKRSSKWGKLVKLKIENLWKLLLEKNEFLEADKTTIKT